MKRCFDVDCSLPTVPSFIHTFLGSSKCVGSGQADASWLMLNIQLSERLSPTVYPCRWNAPTQMLIIRLAKEGTGTQEDVGRVSSCTRVTSQVSGQAAGRAAEVHGLISLCVSP